MLAADWEAMRDLMREALVRHFPVFRVQENGAPRARWLSFDGSLNGLPEFDVVHLGYMWAIFTVPKDQTDVFLLDCESGNMDRLKKWRTPGIRPQELHWLP